MFLKNNLHPAAASASGGTSRPSFRDGMTYSVGNSEAEEFNSFNNHAGSSAKRPAGGNRPGGKKQKFVVDKRVLIIGIAAAAAVLLLIALIIGAALFSSKDITYENNTYIAYTDGDGKYHVAVNGTVLDHEFLGNVVVTPAADNSFAYVEDDGGDNGTIIYLIKGKKLEELTPTTASIQGLAVAKASLVPAVIVDEGDSFRLYIDGTDQTVVKKQSRDPENFQISADASTIAYNALSKDEDGATRRLYIWQDGSSEQIRSSAVPMAISNSGDYVFAANTKTDGTTSLYVITTKDMEPNPVDKSTGFDVAQPIQMNRKGNEILFCTTNGETSSTYYYHFKKNGEGESVRLRDRVLLPISPDPEVSILDTFVGAYLSVVEADGSMGAMYYLNKELAAKPVAEAQGQFSPDGKYFYYIHPTSFLLKQVDLSDDDFNAKTIYNDDVDAFAVTKKGNVYHLDDQGTLRFYDKSEEQNYWKGFSEDISAISFYNYANEVYFVVSDFEEVIVYTSKEGSAKDEAKLGSAELTNVPTFSDPHSKKSYAYYYDMEHGWMLYYTSNGSRFKLISNDCQSINGIEIPEVIG
ncbi:MAG: hypothetical protein IJW44_04265 [Clostridia bacterium]|nr:hypothetical protein [Clostridia bacterium]